VGHYFSPKHFKQVVEDVHRCGNVAIGGPRH
jgi:hypothetical protein